jgi:RimJ/RimL family protein N-acetyltransferase
MPDLRAVPQIATKRLLLRAWRDPDRDAFAQMNADPRVSEFLLGPITRADSHEMVNRIHTCWRQRGYGLWAAERRDTGEFIGYVGLWPATFDAHFTPAVEVGWRLAPEHWGHGFATEGGRVALRYGFEDLGLEEIVSFTAVVNARSVRVMDRLGMQRDRDSDFDHPVMPLDHPARRHVLYRLARLDWARTTTAPV